MIRSSGPVTFWIPEVPPSPGAARAIEWDHLQTGVIVQLALGKTWHRFMVNSRNAARAVLVPVAAGPEKGKRWDLSGLDDTDYAIIDRMPLYIVKALPTRLVVQRVPHWRHALPGEDPA